MALGIGVSGRATPADVAETVGAVLGEAGWSLDDVDVVATRGRLVGDGRLLGLGKPVVGYEDDELFTVTAATPASPALEQLRAPAVAEAAALLAAGPGSRLVVPKRTGSYVTVAAATGPPPRAPTTSRPTTRRPTTRRPTTSRPTTSRPTTSRPTTSRTAR